MQLYVIRHGETEMGKNRLIASIQEPLNDTGINQAKNIGKELNNLNIDIVYCSPIQRAKHTLDLLSLNKNIPVLIEDRLKERDMGIYEKVSFDDIDWDEFWGYNSEQKYAELESMKSVYERITEFLNELKENHNNKNILLVTHGGIARAIYWYFNGIDNSTFICENCKIYDYTV